MKRIATLIIDDEENLTHSLAFALKQAGIDAAQASSGETGLQMAESQRPDVILLDVRLPGQSGLEVLEKLRSKLPGTPVIMISAYGDTKAAVTAIKMGAVDYLSKPFDVDELILLIQESISQQQMETEIRYLREKNIGTDDFIGNSPCMLELRAQIERIAASKVDTILLQGETGVGKAIVARQLHSHGRGKEAPFVEINCASLPEQLLEAELFGAEKGAYTGATARRLGLVEVADGGTMFLDEIGEMSVNLQAKLLMFLESRTFRPIGSPREKLARVRIVAATNRDLHTCVGDGLFRQDLYFRLNVMPVDIPKLTERHGDIWLLANYFAEHFARKEGSKPLTFSKPVRRIFESYTWPGNVRELKNLIERLTILYPGRDIPENLLPTEFSAAPEHLEDSIEQRLNTAEKELVLKALAQSRGRKGQAAEKLGISRHALKRRIQRLGLG